VAAIEDARWLVVGLGNPGPAYARTRHNVGFAVVERLAEEARARFVAGECESDAARVRLGSTPVLLLKPQTFMNRSGTAIAGWLSRLGLPPARLLVVHDDLDLAVGRLRLVAAAGAGGHRGVGSIQESLGTTEFPRVRIGVGRPETDEDAADRVLADVPPEEAATLADSVVRAADAVRSLILEGAGVAMNRYNRRPKSGPGPARRDSEPQESPNGKGR
jgi:peptidyl-tRNA hydrolase, PTH1 family